MSMSSSCRCSVPPRFRAAKQRKQEWQKKMGVVLAEKAEKIRKRRAEIDKLFDDK